MESNIWGKFWKFQSSWGKLDENQEIPFKTKTIFAKTGVIPIFKKHELLDPFFFWVKHLKQLEAEDANFGNFKGELRKSGENQEIIFKKVEKQ